MSALQKTPRYGYYPDPANKEVVEYGPYDTAMQYAPYKTKDPRTGSAFDPTIGLPGQPDAEGRENEAPDPDRAFDPSFGGAFDPSGNAPGSPAGLPQRRRLQRGRTARTPQAGSSLLARNDR